MNLGSHVRQAIRSALDGPFGHGLKDQVFRFEVAREARFVEAQRKLAGLMASTEGMIIQELRSRAEETFFILGSGSSVEDDAANRFRIISQGVSVGINAWVLHDFVPTMYSFEPVPSRESDHYKTLSVLNRPEVLSAMPAILVLRPRTNPEIEQIHQLDEPLLARTTLYGRVAVPTRALRHLPRDTAVALRHLAGSMPSVVTMDSGASIVRMTSLAFQLGFRKIVYVGVDLNHTEYFWERNPSYLQRRGIASFESGQTGSHHETLNADTRPFPVTDVIRGISDGLGVEAGLQLYSGSPGSELARFLPVFPWE